MADNCDHPRRSFLRRSAGTGLLATSLPGLAATSSTAAGSRRHRESIGRVTRSRSFRAVRSGLRDSGFRPRPGDATARTITNGDTGETGTRVSIPFASRDERTARAVGFVDGDESVRIAAGIWVDGALAVQYYSDATLVRTADDGHYCVTHVPPDELGEHVGPPDRRGRSGPRGTGALTLALPGYTPVGTYDLDEVCWVVAGSCFGLFLVTLADLLPGDEAFVGTACGITGGACWIVDTVERYGWCAAPDVALYLRAWWNPIGPPFVGHPVC